MSAAIDPRPDPFPHFARMRATSPVFFNASLQSWELYGYHDIQNVLADHVSFSTEIFGDGPDAEVLGGMLVMDPPRHTQLRKLVSRVFTHKTVAALEPRIEAIAHGLLDRLVDAGHMDLVSDFAIPLPVTALAELLGVPVADHARFKQWSDDATHVMETKVRGRKPEPALEGTFDRINQYIGALIADRRRAPRDDLISGLTEAEIDGDRLSNTEIVAICRGLMLAGHVTTTTVLGNAMHLLLLHPAALPLLRAEPQLIAGAIEEVLRYNPPALTTARITRQEVELGGQRIPAGKRVICYLASGNRDPAVFPDPERFDITRSSNRHLSFGHGIHLCIGAMLARVESRIALAAILQCLPDLRRDENVALEPAESIMMYGLRRLPLLFTPGKRHSPVA
jgi:cytochrome P450